MPRTFSEHLMYVQFVSYVQAINILKSITEEVSAIVWKALQLYIISDFCVSELGTLEHFYVRSSRSQMFFNISVLDSGVVDSEIVKFCIF